MLFNDAMLNIPDNLKVPQRGTVISNSDPRHMGRIKCCVSGVLDEIDPDKLPWIYRWNSHIGGSTDSESMNVPEKGSSVVVEFKDGSIYNGFYTGVWDTEQTKTGLFSADYPNTSGHNSYGNSFITNRKAGYTEYKHQSGASFRVNKDGEVVIRARKITYETEDGGNVMSLDESSDSLSLAGKVSTNIGGPITNITSRELRTNNDIVTETAKTKTSTITGGQKAKVGGAKTTAIGGNSGTVVAGATDDFYGRKVTTTYGMGYDETIATIGILQKIIAGVISTSILTGSESHKVGIGNYDVSVGAGNIGISTKLGLATVGNLLAKLSIGLLGEVGLSSPTGSLKMDPKTGTVLEEKNPLGIQIKAAKLALGMSPAGFILTSVSDPIVDTISGMPHIGVPTITAG